MPTVGAAEHERYLEWLHYAEGSAMLPLMLILYTLRLGEAARRSGAASTARSKTISAMSRPR